MAFSDMQTNVKNWSGVNSTDKVKAAINAVYRMIVNKFFWPQLVAENTITLEANKQTYSLNSLTPTFRWIKRVWYRSGSDSSPIPLRANGGIFRISITGGTIFRFRVKRNSSTFVWEMIFDDVPNQAFIDQHPTIRFEYYYQPPDLSADGDIVRFDAGDVQVIEFMAVLLLVGKQSDIAGFAMFDKMSKDALGDMEDKAINFMGRPIVAPGEEITEQDIQSDREEDYGRRIG
ncbi:hypothetical protein LCGC14_1496280 [marine sediment metagenome]|uniref:Uncharacterized protein n=1 Tax=marine sediment metagenome TaxID=412755 RepID=A0A0F9LKZ0_9ZZZZ|nr:hypothetical protein [Pricia sp.]